MDVQELLVKLDALNYEGSLIQDQIKSLDEQLSKAELDFNIIEVQSLEDHKS